MKYKIQIDHDSGSSYGSDEMLTDLEFVWEDKSVAEENIRRIKEHYDYTCLCDYPNEATFDKTIEYPESCKTYSDIIDCVNSHCKNKEWYNRGDEYSLKLIAPNGKNYTQQVFWHGYHDCLRGVNLKTV